MKIAEIRELSTKELLERVDAEVAAYDQKKINHSISPIIHRRDAMVNLLLIIGRNLCIYSL